MLDLPFKGNRKYLHSTDIFNACLRVTGAGSDLSLKISDMISHPLEALPACAAEVGKTYPARFSGRSPNGAHDLVLREREDKAVERRIDYDEDRIASGSMLHENRVESEDLAGVTAIERIVALNKYLIQTTARPGKTLLFASIFLRRLPQTAFIRLQLESRLGTRLFRSSIHGRDELLGEIVFYGV